MPVKSQLVPSCEHVECTPLPPRLNSEEQRAKVCDQMMTAIFCLFPSTKLPNRKFPLPNPFFSLKSQCICDNDQNHTN